MGVLLADVRDRKLYEALRHPDMVSYASERLHLAKTSLYRYLRVHDWIAEYHKEWLEPKPKGFIPELTDVADLIWIEKELGRKELEPDTRSKLEEFRKKALDGTLRDGEVAKLRRKGHTADEGLRSFLSKLRNLRMRGSELEKMPGDVILYLDEAIEVLRNALALERAGTELAGTGKKSDR